jgi:galactofuranose transport system substrate-binding protein
MTASFRHTPSLLIPLVLFLSGLAFFSCGAKKNAAEAKDAREGIILGFSQIGSESAWRTYNTRSVREAAEQNGVQLLFENAEQKQENQIKAIRSFIAYQVDVIAFVPIVTDGWDNVLREAKQAGIPVLVTDREIKTADESLYAGFIGTDSIQEGRESGKFLIRKFAGSGKKTVNVIELSGTEGASVALGRAQGFREALSGHPEFKILHSESGDFMRSKGYEIMISVLERYKDADAVFCHNDAMMLGTLDAMGELGIRPGKDIVIVTIDAQQAAIDALRLGQVNCAVECNPKIGPTIMELAAKLARGESIPRVIHVDEKVFSEDDPDLADIPARGY